MGEVWLGSGASLRLGVRALGVASELGRAGDARPRGPLRRSSLEKLPRASGTAPLKDQNKDAPSRANPSVRGLTPSIWASACERLERRRAKVHGAKEHVVVHSDRKWSAMTVSVRRARRIGALYVGDSRLWCIVEAGKRI